jgi:paired amphipathic helix protein Sin3a
LEFNLPESGRLVEDLVRLVKIYLKSTCGYSSTDRKAILKFFSTFIPEFFAWKKSAVNDSIVPPEELALGVSSDSDGENESSKAVKLFVSDDSSTDRLLFANNTLFAFMRLVELSLERLSKMKVYHDNANEKSDSSNKSNVMATFLDFQTKERAPLIGKDYYKSLLYLLKQLLYGDLDSSTFEEQTRFMFGNDAYPMFTFDKLLQAIVKQAQLVLLDPACEQLIRLFDSWKDLKRSSKNAGNWRLSEYSIRLAAENFISSNAKDNLFRIEFIPKNNKMGFQMLEKLFDSAGGSVEAKWSSYVDGFVKLDPNPLYLNPKSKVFLKRCLRKSALTSDSLDSALIVEYNLECKICINTYKLFYVENTEDCLYRMTKIPESYAMVDEKSQKRFKNWWAGEWDALGYGSVDEAEANFKAIFSLE